MADQRRALVTIALTHVYRNKKNQEKWHYAEVRPIPYKTPLNFPVTTDCSGFVSLCFYEAGCFDPNNCNFNGSGYTGTLLDHGTRITRDKVVPGDVIVYGAYPGQHTALVVNVTNQGDILTASHGQEGDPSLVWCGAPKGPLSGHPVDDRQPTYLRFRTAKKGVLARLRGK